MKKMLMLGAVLALLAGYSAAASAADGHISKGLLADMGLSGMKVMSDSDATHIRGKGFAIAFSGSSAYSADTYGFSGTKSGALYVGHHSAHAFSNAAAGNGSYSTSGAAGAWGH